MYNVNINGGGPQANKNGKIFEDEIKLIDIFNDDETIFLKKVKSIDNKWYTEVYKNNILIGYYLPKYRLYDFLSLKGVDFNKHISSRLFPDDGFLNIKNNTLYIIEKKYQKRHGSVDEKLQTCDFKKKQYSKLMQDINVKVEYIYILNNWFKQEKYKDVKEYIKSVGCHYYFNEIPLEIIF